MVSQDESTPLEAAICDFFPVLNFLPPKLSSGQVSMLSDSKALVSKVFTSFKLVFLIKIKAMRLVKSPKYKRRDKATWAGEMNLQIRVVFYGFFLLGAILLRLSTFFLLVFGLIGVLRRLLCSFFVFLQIILFLKKEII